MANRERILRHNLVQAQRWYRHLMAESARGHRILPAHEAEARDAVLVTAAHLRREVEAREGRRFDLSRLLP